VIGFAAFAWLIGTLVTGVARVYRNADSPPLRGLAGGFLAAVMGVLVHGIGANSFIIIRIMEPFWLIAAVVLAMPHLSESGRPVAATPAGAWRGAPQPAR
jgi:hypothetical protein